MHFLKNESHRTIEKLLEHANFNKFYKEFSKARRLEDTDNYLKISDKVNLYNNEKTLQQ